MRKKELKVHMSHSEGIGPRCGEGRFKRLVRPQDNQGLVTCRICLTMRDRGVETSQKAVFAAIAVAAHSRALHF